MAYSSSGFSYLSSSSTSSLGSLDQGRRTPSPVQSLPRDKTFIKSAKRSERKESCQHSLKDNDSVISSGSFIKERALLLKTEDNTATENSDSKQIESSKDQDKILAGNGARNTTKDNAKDDSKDDSLSDINEDTDSITRDHLNSAMNELPSVPMLSFIVSPPTPAGGRGGDSPSQLLTGRRMSSDQDSLSPRSNDEETGGVARLIRAFPIESEEEDVQDRAGLPSSVTVSKSGELLVVDHFTQLAKLFSPSGYLKYSFGAGILKSPWGVFESVSGRIVVSDSETADLKVFNTQGKFLKTSELGCHLMRPCGIAYHPVNRRLLVADPDSGCVYVHDSAGIVTDIISVTQEEISQSDPNVADNNNNSDQKKENVVQNREQYHEDDQESCFSLATGEERQSTGFKPKYVHYDQNSNIYVTDTANNTLYVFSPEHKLKYRYGSYGNCPQQLANPGGVTTDANGNVLLADTGNSRVHMLNAEDGTLKGHVLTWEDGLAEPQAVAVDNLGYLVVTEASTGLIKVYDYQNVTFGDG